MPLPTIAIPFSNMSGFSLMEILISLLILSLGILGTIKMQVNTMQVARQTTYYSDAVQLATEMADQLRARKLHPTATQEITEWLQRTNQALPNARAVICRDASPWNSETHSLRWNCSTSNEDSSNPPNNNVSIIIKLGWTDPTDRDSSPPPRVALAVNP